MLDRFAGALLGTAVGDALGMPVEGWDPADIQARFGTLRDMIEARSGRGRYTDDTEMMIALAESLIRSGGVDEADLGRSFVENCHPERGYGWGTSQVLALMRAEVPGREAALRVFPGGSFGNGSAMRVAPLGLFYFRRTELLRDAAYTQSDVTHAHPLAREGSYLQALAVAWLAGHEHGSVFCPLAFTARLGSAVSHETPSFARAFGLIESFLRKPPPMRQVADRLGHDSRVIRSQPTALYAFLAHAESFEEAVAYAVNLGGDADTLGAMAGALAGAFHGAQAIPRRWLESLENGEKGRDYILALARELLETSPHRPGAA